MLLRMKKALRSKSAAQKRQAWEDQLEEKRQKLQQKDADAQSGTYLIFKSIRDHLSLIRYRYH